MKTKPAILGTCALCKEQRELLDSHLMAAAIYKHLREPTAANPNPAIMSKNVTRQTSWQVTGHVFCASCEHLLNVNGEDWVLENYYRNGKGFSLRQKIQEKSPLIQDGNLKVYACRDIESIEYLKLVYFAASIFWRASLQTWNHDGKVKSFITLGRKYEEQFRRYLMGEAVFPDNAALIVWVSATPEPLLAANVPIGGKQEDYHIYRFSIPGLRFHLALGNGIPGLFRRYCLHRSPEHIVLMADDVDEAAKADLSWLMKNTRFAKNLIQAAANYKRVSEKP